MPTYKLLNRQEFPATDPLRRGLVDVTYIYMDERFQTVQVTLPLEEDRPERVEEELRKKAAHAAAAGPAEIVI